VEHDFECPQCESKVASLDRLKADEEMRERVKEYQLGREGEAALEDIKEEGGEGGESVEVDEKMREKVRETEETKVRFDLLSRRELELTE
jgi:protein MPE1